MGFQEDQVYWDSKEQEGILEFQDLMDLKAEMEIEVILEYLESRVHQEDQEIVAQQARMDLMELKDKEVTMGFLVSLLVPKMEKRVKKACWDVMDCLE